MTLADERRIAQTATPGPWEERTDDADMLHVVHDSEYVSYVCTVGGKEAPNAESDAEFIATFNPKRVLELLDQIEASKSLIEDCWDRLAAVEKLHSPVEAIAANGNRITVCNHCVGDLAYVFDEQLNWPCPTIKAARGE